MQLPRNRAKHGVPRLDETPEALKQRLDRYFNILRAIEARGLGSPRVMAIAERWADRAPNEPWYRLLGTAKDIHETREVGRAVAEWSDADSIGAHYGYGNDLLCTLDVAAGEGRRGDAAILDADNRFFFSSRRRHTRYWRDWSSDVCSSDLGVLACRPDAKTPAPNLL